MSGYSPRCSRSRQQRAVDDVVATYGALVRCPDCDGGYEAVVLGDCQAVALRVLHDPTCPHVVASRRGEAAS